MKWKLTPADEHVDDKVSVFGEDDDEQRVEVQALHQQPEEVGHDEVLEEHQAGFTPHLKHTKVKDLNCVSNPEMLKWKMSQNYQQFCNSITGRWGEINL